jgi:hypothetical protein
MKGVARMILKSCGVSTDDALIKHVADYIEMLVFNVCALARIVMLLYDAKSFTSEHLIAVRQYISDKCPSRSHAKQTGGTSMPSDFYGYAHPAYSAANQGGDALHIDFQNGVARPEISGGGSRRRECSDAHDTKIFAIILKKVGSEGIRFSGSDSHVKENFVKYIENHINCLRSDIVSKALSKKDKLKASDIDAILSKHHYRIFH